MIQSLKNSKFELNDQTIQYMLFDLKTEGHHPNYIRHLIQYWHLHNLNIDLNVVVSPFFFSEHKDIVNLADSYSLRKVRFITISEQEAANLQSHNSSSSRLIRNFQEWNLLCKYATLLNTNHCLIMFLDTCELPLALGLKPPCPTSGIYFRPTFHYSHFTNGRIPSTKERLQHLREKFYLSRTLKNPRMHKLFCLDPFVSSHINTLYKTDKAITLVDPVEIQTVSCLQIEELRKKLGVQPDRRIFLLFGSIDSRKGIYKLIDALSKMPYDLCKQICFLIIGKVKPADQGLVELELAKLRQHQPIQVITVSEFISDREVYSYFCLADAVMAVYQRHVGMSGILLLAAATQKPVLSSDYGLMGELVHHYCLGLAVDSTQPQKISEGLIKLLTEPLEEIIDRNLMKQFAEQNSIEKFGATIFQSI